jgi:tetratricopeptide (TPR) repeat protein
MAQYYVDKNKPELALGHLRMAYHESATDWPTTSFYLSLLIKTDDREEAKKVKAEIAEQYANDSAALWVLSMVEFQLGNTQASIDTLVNLHKKEPDSIRVINALAKLYRQAGKYELSSNMWLKAMEANPSDINLITELISDRVKAAGPDKLIDYLNTNAAKNPQIAAPLHAATIELLVNNGQMAEAKKLFSQYSDSSQPQTKLMQAAILRGEAIALAEQEQWEAALNKIQEASTLVKNNVGLALLKARLEVKNGKTADAEKTLTNALKAQPNNLRLIVEKTKFLAQSNTPKVAFEFLEPIWKKQPHGGLAQVYFGLVNQINPQKMEAAVKELLNVEPNNAGALNTMAGIKQQQGDNNEAITFYKKAIDVSPNLVPALNNLAWILRDSQPKDALAYSSRAAKLAPNSAAVLDTHGWILHLNGQKEEAIRYIDRALELAPNNEDIKSHRAQI